MTRAAIRPLSRMWEVLILKWALRELPPTHSAVPQIVRRLNDRERTPPPMDPADSIVTGACLIAALALLGMCLAGWV